jgi:hypothetical protein
VDGGVAEQPVGVGWVAKEGEGGLDEGDEGEDEGGFGVVGGHEALLGGRRLAQQRVRAVRPLEPRRRRFMLV